VAKTDFIYKDHGSLIFLWPVSDEAKDWVSEHIQLEDWQEGSIKVVFEPRYFEPVLNQIQADELVIRRHSFSQVN